MIIQTHRELSAFCEKLLSQQAICLDTEFAGEGRYYREVGTIQIAAGAQIALVDPLAVHDLSPLLPALTHPGIVKVFHAGEQDLEIFYRLLGRTVAPVFDTQIAAALLGYGDQVSFGKLLETIAGIRLEKSHTFTDWLRRPLSKSQVEYALDDVRYLGRLYDRLEQDLRARGRMEWAREEFGALERADRFTPADESQLYRRLKGADRLSAQELGVLQQLAAWREQTARQVNLPPGRIAMDAVLIELARRPRKSVRELAEVRGLNSRQIEKFGPGMIDALRRGARNSSPPIKRAVPLPSGLEPTVDFLSLCLRALAREQSVSTAILANRTDLARLAAFGDHAPIHLLRGWRREIVGASLLAALQGNVVARIVPSSREVHLEWQHPKDQVTPSPGSPSPAPEAASLASPASTGELIEEEIQLTDSGDE
jgi:ribonuclease D